jgi:hypothetical protein
VASENTRNGSEGVVAVGGYGGEVECQAKEVAAGVVLWCWVEMEGGWGRESRIWSAWDIHVELDLLFAPEDFSPSVLPPLNILHGSLNRGGGKSSERPRGGDPIDKTPPTSDGGLR